MSTTPSTNRDHAIVLGGSIAGLFAARILSDHFRQVTIIERDPVHDEAESRKGQPQTRHLHGVLEPVQRFIVNHLPGVEQKLIDDGAQVGDFGEFVHWYQFGGYKVHGHIGLQGMSLSRPLLEWQVRRAVSALPNVTLRADTAAEELLTNPDRSRVTGVKVNHRLGQTGAENLEADLVVDASGRGSATPKWLTQMGYPAPTEEEVKVQITYATRLYKREPDPVNGTRVIMISPTPPKGKHGAFLFPIEGDRWIVTMGCGYGLAAPTDEASFMELLRALPAPDVYDVLSHSEPLSEIVSYSFPASRRRRYDKLSRFPEGYLILGDAVASFNPIYGQGMASAALQAGALGKILTRSNLHGAWRSFFRYTAKIIARPWQLAVGEDFRYPETTGHKPIGTNLINRYVERVHRAVHHDRVVYHQFLKVIHLIEPPISLMKPQIAWRVFRAARSK